MSKTTRKDGEGMEINGACLKKASSLTWTCVNNAIKQMCERKERRGGKRRPFVPYGGGNGGAYLCSVVNLCVQTTGQVFKTKEGTTRNE